MRSSEIHGSMPTRSLDPRPRSIEIHRTTPTRSIEIHGTMPTRTVNPCLGTTGIHRTTLTRSVDSRPRDPPKSMNLRRGELWIHAHEIRRDPWIHAHEICGATPTRSTAMISIGWPFGRISRGYWAEADSTVAVPNPIGWPYRPGQV